MKTALLSPLAAVWLLAAGPAVHQNQVALLVSPGVAAVALSAKSKSVTKAPLKHQLRRRKSVQNKQLKHGSKNESNFLQKPQWLSKMKGVSMMKQKQRPSLGTLTEGSGDDEQEQSIEELLASGASADGAEAMASGTAEEKLAQAEALVQSLAASAAITSESVTQLTESISALNDKIASVSGLAADLETLTA